MSSSAESADAAVPFDPLPCPHRASVHQSGGQEYARCHLLAEITGADLETTPPLLRASCEACLTQAPPSAKQLNDMVASRLFLFTRAIEEQDGVIGCDASKAARLKDWAMRHLPGMPAGGPPKKRSAPSYSGPCFHLGEQRGEVNCSTCKGRVRLKTFACLHEQHEETTIRHCRACDDYDPQLKPATVRTWAIGVTTAPRRQPTLERTLRSLRQAGWHGPVHLFAEPDTPIPPEHSNLVIVRRALELGAWPNWLLGLTELHLRAPHADAYLMLQDDAVFVSGLRAYLERTLWPAGRLGVVSLHTPSHQARDGLRGYFASTVGWNAWGAMAFVFPQASLRALLRDPHVVDHRSRGMGEGLRNVDSVVGDWCRRKELPFYLHAPSLCQHTGLTTTLWSRDSLDGRRSADDFPGEDVDITEWLDRGSASNRREAIKSSQTKALAIVAVHIGRQDCFRNWSDWLGKTALPREAELLIVDNSANPSFRASCLEPLARRLVDSHRFRQCRILEGPGPAFSGKRLSVAKMQSYADALTIALRETTGSRVLTVDDDVIPPEDGIEKLNEAFEYLARQGHRVGAVSGCYESATATGYLVASRSRESWNRRPRVGELGPDDLVEVGFVGNGCCLMDGDAIRQILPVTPRLPSGSVLGPDGYLCTRLRAESYSIWLHGGVVCQHLFGSDDEISPNLPIFERPGLFVDLGFHHGEGFHKLMMALRIAPDWRLEIFEPNPACRPSLELFGRHFPAAHLHRAAAWIRLGTVSFRQEDPLQSGTGRSGWHPLIPDGLDGAGSTVMSQSVHRGLREAISVPSIDFSDWLHKATSELTDGEPVVVKMDIEGAEYPVLRKLLDDGTATRIDHLFVEFHHRFLPDEDAKSTAYLRQRLQEAGVIVHRWQ